MASNGRGISDAVRGAISEWMTSQVIDLIWDEWKTEQKTMTEANKPSFVSRLRRDTEWVRIGRSRGNRGWVRTYYSKAFADRRITLEVQTNPDDTHIEYVFIKLAGKTVGGGKVWVPSVNTTQIGRRATITMDQKFLAFTEAQLAKLRNDVEFDDFASIDLMFEERFV